MKLWGWLLVGLAILPGILQAQENRDCLACHAHPEQLTRLVKVDEQTKQQVSMLVDDKVFARSAHGKFPCIDCHPDLEDVEGMHAAELEPVDCVTFCHEPVAATIAASQHVQFMRERQETPPSCKGCHAGEHSRRDTPVAADPWHRQQSIADCSGCHREWLASYQHTLHGQLTAFGPVTTALPTCADCHGYHQVVSPPHPQSRLGAEQLLRTCQRCHAEATATFVDYVAHPQWRVPAPHPVFASVHRIATGILGVVLGGMTLHGGLWCWRALRERGTKGE